MAITQPSASISDVDADGDDDVEMIEEPDLGPPDDEELEDADGESEEEEDQEGNQSVSSSKEDDHGHDVESEEGDTEVDAKYNGAVKLPEGGALNSVDEDDEDEDSSEEESADNAVDSDASEESSESGADNEWEKEQSVDGEGEVADIAARNDCVFCGLDEEHDPSEDFEEYLACAVCGDNSHRQCAREHGSFKDESIDPASWKCPSCIENGLEAGTAAETDDQNISIQRRLSISSSRITRDLLPAARGTPKPGSHSIFDTLILEDDPGDGARALRKRKSDEAIEDGRSRSSSKRPKTSDGKREATSSPMATGRAVRSTTTASRTRRTSAVVEPKTEVEDPPIVATSRPQRQRRSKREEMLLVRSVRKSQNSLVLAFRIDLSRINWRPPKRKHAQRRSRPSHSAASASASGAPLHALTPYTTPYYAFHDRENDDSKKPPYGGILKEDEADTGQTMPTAEDRAKFEVARQRAEEDWKKRTAAADAEQETKGRTSQKVSGPPSKIKSIIFGKWEIDTWYAAPYPEEYSRNRVLYICEFCLKYMGSDFVAWRHKLKCPCKYPPGDEIYRDGSISVFEVDGRKNPAYCQNLCLLAKLFLGSKTLYYDVEPFLFYIMTEYDEHGYHFVGYFSKEKRPSSMNNVSCILTMPHHQRKGYGHLLIDFSYLLTRKECRTGSPEKPLSDMGLVSYRNYWRLQLCYLLIDAEPGTDTMSVRSISDTLGMTPDDVISQLEALRVLVRDPVTKSYAFRLDKAYFKEAIEKWEAKGYQRLNPDRLVWTPYIMSRTSNLAIFDRPPISTVAPRDDGEDEDDILPEEGLARQQQLELGKHMAEARNGTVISDFATNIVVERPGTPIQGVSEMALSSPAKPLALTLTNGITNTEQPGAPQSPIPPWRYELWPPVPGTIYRSRRGGYRPKGSRITAHGPIFGGNSGGTPMQQTTPRGSRTSLRVSNKAGNGMGDGSGALIFDATDANGSVGVKANPAARRSTRSRVGTPGAEAAVGGYDGAVEEADNEEEDDDEEEEEGEEEEEAVVDGGGDESEEGEEDEDANEDEEDEEDEEESAEEDAGRDRTALDEDVEGPEDADADADEDYEDAEEDAEGEDEDEDVAMDE